MKPLPIKTYQPLLDFWIPGEPVPKGRPRLGAEGNVRTPEKTKAGENWVRANLTRVTLGIHIDPSGEFEVLVDYHTHSIVKDLDNLIKLTLDALNGYVWLDDRQVTHIDARLARIEQGQEPGCHLIINRAP